MDRSRLRVCALVGCCVAFAGVAVGQANPWNGTWKADTAGMKYSGPTYSVMSDGAGYTVTMGDTAQPKVMCDGQAHEADGGMMRTCTKTATGFEVVNTHDGKTTSKTTMTVSGNMMTRKREVFPPDGPSYTMTFMSKRVGSGKGADGKWQETSFAESQDTGMLTISVDGDTVAFKETDNDKPVSCKLDGSETDLGGGGSMSMKLVDPHTLKVWYKNNGKAARENTFVLSADGKTITETDVTAAPAVSTMVLKLRKT